MSVKIPSRWNESECVDCKYAYEDGWYDGRDTEAENTNPITDVGAWIKEYKLEHNVSYRDLSKISGVNAGSLSNYVNAGQTPPFGLALDLFDSLGYELCLRPKV